tara:strand:+ start:477 stop:893 length:417 start_codon:yes stop_codon:yes gene_type:complete
MKIDLVSLVYDDFIYSKENLKYLEKYNLCMNNGVSTNNIFNNKYSLTIYYELFFGSKIACGNYIGAGDCIFDTFKLKKIYYDYVIQKCKKCEGYYCISCYNFNCIFCSLLNLDSLDLINMTSDKIVIYLLQDNSKLGN